LKLRLFAFESNISKQKEGPLLKQSEESPRISENARDLDLQQKWKQWVLAEHLHSSPDKE
jgi:hypothetical protein